jgi:4-hydroxy-2-oxoheptanedioate aldolase
LHGVVFDILAARTFEGESGTLVTADELPHWLEKGVQFLYIHSDPFLRLGLNGIKKSLGAVSFRSRSQHEVAKWRLNFSN